MNDSKRVDLHIHSTASDGQMTPLEVVQCALERHLRAISITDHDSVAAIEVSSWGSPTGEPMSISWAISSIPDFRNCCRPWNDFAGTDIAVGRRSSTS
jgi:histidinol phosphatase-like PHP family hydrolase